MKKTIALIGYGGFAREVFSYIKKPCVFFVSDKLFNSLKIKHDNSYIIKPISQFESNKYEALITVGSPQTKLSLVNELPSDTIFTKYIHPSVVNADINNKINDGVIICPGCTLTTNIEIGKHVHLNPQTKIGHDTNINDFVTISPGATISGRCNIGKYVYIGASSCIKENISIVENSVIGMNAGVTKNIYKSGIYIGTPAVLLNKESK